MEDRYKDAGKAIGKRWGWRNWQVIKEDKLGLDAIYIKQKDGMV